jgi:hypothetical protein
MFRIGQKVVYIGPDCRDMPAVIRYGFNVPVPNEVYTIRSPRMVYPPNGWGSCGGIGYTLVEVTNAIIPELGHELLIDEYMLRPVVDTKQEISFTAGADPSTEQFDNRKQMVPATLMLNGITIEFDDPA